MIKYLSIYKEGQRQFEARTSDFNEYESLLEDLSWNAYYNDGHKTQSDAEAYYIIVETMTEAEANDWIEERLTNNTEGAA